MVKAYSNVICRVGGCHMQGALILAGGKSSRLPEDKALIPLEDKPLLLHVVEETLLLTHEIVVVIGKNDKIDNYITILPSKVTVLKDTVEGKGPLVGILTGMQRMRSEYSVVLPCDSPFIKREVLEHLFERAQGADAAIPRWPNGNIEPLHAVYRILPSIPAAETALREDELLIVDMIKRLGKVVYVSTDELKRFDQELITFFNINNQEDLKAAKRLKSKK